MSAQPYRHFGARHGPRDQISLPQANLLKRLESSVRSFRLTLQSLRANHEATLVKIAAFNQSGGMATVDDLTQVLEGLEAEEDELFQLP